MRQSDMHPDHLAEISLETALEDATRDMIAAYGTESYSLIRKTVRFLDKKLRQQRQVTTLYHKAPDEQPTNRLIHVNGLAVLIKGPYNKFVHYRPLQPVGTYTRREWFVKSERHTLRVFESVHGVVGIPYGTETDYFYTVASALRAAADLVTLFDNPRP